MGGSQMGWNKYYYHWVLTILIIIYSMEESERWVWSQVAEAPHKRSQMTWKKYFYC